MNILSEFLFYTSKKKIFTDFACARLIISQGKDISFIEIVYFWIRNQGIFYVQNSPTHSG